MAEGVNDYWRIAFLEQEEAVDDIARMASIAENLCIETFGDIAPDNSACQDALFTVKHLAEMIEDFQTTYLGVIIAYPTERATASTLESNQIQLVSSDT
jgi:hypothetical protein